MRNILNWMQRNILAVVLAVVLIVVVIGFIVFTILSQSSNRVVSAEDASTMIVQPNNPDAGANAASIGAIPAGATTFCLQIDGRQNGHIPMLLGVDGPEIIWNSERTGKNYVMVASSDETKDVGVLLDGRIYAKVAFLEKWGMTQSCAMKCDQTGWSPFNMTSATIGGERSLEFQLK